MNNINKLYCRIYQTVFHIALPFLPYREPKILDSVDVLPYTLKQEGKSSVLLVTDSFLRESKLTARLEKLLEQNGICCTVYDKTKPNPTVENVEEGKAMYLENGCDSLIAFGGGSPMDCAKAIGACIAYPKRSLKQMKGNLRVLRKIPLLIAIPTTAGTGSEATLTAVIMDAKAHHKYTMNDFPLIPRYAVLDPAVTYTLPQSLTATTGMDALTHAVEVYIGRSTTKETRAMSVEAIRLIFKNIETAYHDGTNEKARAGMLRAAYLAGCAFSKSYVGYVHAVAHSLGGQYNIPHGLANSVLLPIFLESYGEAIHSKLRELSLTVGISGLNESDEEAAKKFIAAVCRLNRNMQIPKTLSDIRREDIDVMAAYADKEANPLYPVPVLWDKKELEVFYEKIADWSDTDGESKDRSDLREPA